MMSKRERERGGKKKTIERVKEVDRKAVRERKWWR